MIPACICEAVRTPVGRYGGALAAVRPDDLAATAIAALMQRCGVDWEALDDVLLGNLIVMPGTCATHQLQRTGARYALCTMCIGVGGPD